MTHEDYIGIRQTLAQNIKGTVWEGHVFLVGGCVRDAIMHDEIHDIDLAVDIVNGGIRFVRWLEKKHLTAKGRRPMIFMHFGTAKVRLRSYPQHEIDCVQTRKDKYIYEDHPRPEYNFGTVLEDAIRRDLTINSLFVNVSTGELLDPTGMGLSDIENHVIRTPNAPDITLTDNPMHVLRCIRFAAKYGWEINDTLKESLRRNVSILGTSTKNRIVKETTSLLSIANKERALRLIDEIGAKDYVEPVIQFIESQPQESHHKKRKKRYYHHRRKKKSPSDSAQVSGRYRAGIGEVSGRYRGDIGEISEKVQ